MITRSRMMTGPTLCHRGREVAWLALVFVAAGTASGHGTLKFQVGVADGAFTVSPGVYRNFSIEEMLVSDGLVITNEGEPGFDPAASLLPLLPASVQVRFVQPLVYWNLDVAADAPLPVPAGTVRVNFETQVTGTGIGGPDIAYLAPFISAESHHHLAWTLHNPDEAGLYGLWARIESQNRSVLDFAPSDPFLIVLNYGITSSSDYDEGVDRLALTAVPEPSTLALAGVAIVAVGWRWCRARRRPAGLKWLSR
jgi:hypothetical protein